MDRDDFLKEAIVEVFCYFEPYIGLKSEASLLLDKYDLWDKVRKIYSCEVEDYIDYKMDQTYPATWYKNITTGKIVKAIQWDGDIIQYSDSYPDWLVALNKHRSLTVAVKKVRGKIVKTLNIYDYIAISHAKKGDFILQDLSDRISSMKAQEFNTKYKQIEKPAVVNLVARIEKVFPKAFVNSNDELILNEANNTYFKLADINDKREFDYKLLSYGAGACITGKSSLKQYYRDGMRKWFNKKFTEKELHMIHAAFGNNTNKELGLEYIDAGLHISVISSVEEEINNSDVTK